MRTVLAVLVLLLSGSIGSAEQAGPVAQRLVGAWRMLSFESFDQNGAARPGNYDVGMIVYDASGRMSAHLMHSSNKASAPLTDDADRAAAYRRYLGYWGPFSVDEAKGIVVHRVEGSSNPSWVGSDQVRHYRLSADGKRLTLSVKNGDRVTSTLQWERMP
jgi:lipocalin-like protein